MSTDCLGRRRNPSRTPTTSIAPNTEWERDGERRTVVLVRPKIARGCRRYMEIRWLDKAGNLFSASSVAFERWAQGAKQIARRIA